MVDGMIELDVIYTVWLREVKGYLRSKERFIGSLALPFFWFVIFGGGLGSSIQFKGLQMDYSTFLVPGIIAMPLLFTSVLSGVSVIWDRELGFLKEMLAAPVSRISIVLGKSLGGASIATLQGVMILLLSMFIGLKIGASLLVLIPIMLLVSVGFTSLGIAAASLLKTLEGFNVMSNFVVMPLFFLSGAFFPINALPGWLGLLSRINPMTYGVEVMRYIITGSSTITFSISLGFVLIYSTLTTIFGSYLFSKTQKG